MEDFIIYNELYDYYEKLLTDKQREYFKKYYFDNLSLSEIAEIYKVSRNAISKELKVTKVKLREYEDKLKLKEKHDNIVKVLGDKKVKEIEKFI